jgi:hypothetical protein
VHAVISAPPFQRCCLGRPSRPPVTVGGATGPVNVICRPCPGYIGTGGYPLGAQAGEESIRRLASDAGYTRFRRVAETPFGIGYQARP